MIYCGVDGGGTKTKIMLYKNDDFLGEIVVESSSLTIKKQELSIKRITDGIRQLYTDLELDELIDSIFLGIGGVPSKENIDSFISKLHSPYFKEDIKIGIDNDIANAFESACMGRPSIAFIIGTGSVAFGKDEEGNSCRIGGVHYHEGDLGSGYNIGITSLRYMSKAFDGRVDSTPFTDYLLERFNIKTMGDISDLFMFKTEDRTFIASIAKDAYSYFEQGDDVASKIFYDKASDIVDHIRAVDKRINLNNRELGIIGSLGNAPLYFEIIKKKVLEYDDTFEVHSGLVDPCVGSILIAKKMTES